MIENSTDKHYYLWTIATKAVVAIAVIVEQAYFSKIDYSIAIVECASIHAI